MPISSSFTERKGNGVMTMTTTLPDALDKGTVVGVWV